ncbi:COX15/CtaA family protein [Elongatibacter sediminis]|uniref:COX15/CtaA family protein n=1 Tax=Elongatibacter sediminis TaxID=3119006 RepID=A0AAW9RP87_9GAMM
MKTLAGFSLILVIVLVSLSAYLRLAHSGIGCADWPACYGLIGTPAAGADPAGLPSAAQAGSAYRNLLERSGESMAWATPLHRLVASVLGLAIVFLNMLAWRQGRHRVIALILLGLTVWLALLGIRSGSLHDPAVVMGNLAGGFAMLALIGWLRFRLAGPHPVVRSTPPWLTASAIALLSVQIILGGLTSANFAATACSTLPDCHGGWWPGPELGEAMDLSRHHEVTPSGRAVGGPERIAIHRAHRIGALLAGFAALLAGLLACRHRRARVTGGLITLLAVAEFGVGVASVRLDLPIGLAVAHNWLAGLLLLGLLWLLVITTRADSTRSAPA